MKHRLSLIACTFLLALLMGAPSARAQSSGPNAPQVTTLSPNAVQVGQIFYILGTNLDDVTDVHIGKVPCTFEVKWNLFVGYYIKVWMPPTAYTFDVYCFAPDGIGASSYPETVNP